MLQSVGLSERVSKQVQVLQTQLSEAGRKYGELVVSGGQEVQLGEPADVERQPQELVMVQLEVDQLLQLTEASGQDLQLVLTQVQMLERGLQARGAQAVAKALQVVVVQDQLGEAAQVTDGGRQLLDVVVAEVQPAQRSQTQHAHVHTGQSAVRHLQLLQRVREAGRERIVLLRQNAELLLGFLHIAGAGRAERRQRDRVRVTTSVCQPSGGEEALQAAAVGL